MQCLSYKLCHTSSALVELDTSKWWASLRSKLQKSQSSTTECRSSPGRLFAQGPQLCSRNGQWLKPYGVESWLQPGKIMHGLKCKLLCTHVQKKKVSGEHPCDVSGCLGLGPREEEVAGATWFVVLREVVQKHKSGWMLISPPSLPEQHSCLDSSLLHV